MLMVSDAVEYVRRGPAVAAEPRVSVIVPAYRPTALDAALDSVRAQTFGSWQLIVVDDGSPEPVEPACADDLVLVRQANTGPGGARNLGTSLATGEYLAFLDSDDRWLPEKLARQVAFHDADPGCVLSTTDLIRIWPDGRRERLDLARRYGLKPGRVPFERLFHENCVMCSSAMCRRDAVGGTSGMHPTRRAAEDYGLWLRLGMSGAVGYLAEPLVEQTMHDGSLMATGHREGTWHEGELATYREFLTEHPELREAPFVRRALARAEFDRGYDLLVGGSWAQAAEAFRAALAHRPREWRAALGWLRARLHIGARRVLG